MEIIAIILEQVLQELIKQGVNYIIRKTVDALGNTVTEILYKYDSDGDGIEDAEQVIYTLDTCIPDMSEGYAIVNKGDEIGIGLPQYELVDAVDMVDRLVDMVTGNNNGYLIGDDVYVPLPFDYTGDGQLDWGRVVDEDGNGIPDASDNAPFYPVGSDGYNSFISNCVKEKIDCPDFCAECTCRAIGVCLKILYACNFKRNGYIIYLDRFFVKRRPPEKLRGSVIYLMKVFLSVSHSLIKYELSG